MGMINLKIDIEDSYVIQTGDTEIINQAFENAAKAVREYTGHSGFLTGKDGKCHGRWEIAWWAKDVVITR